MDGVVTGAHAQQDAAWNYPTATPTSGLTREQHWDHDGDVDVVLGFLNTLDVESGTDLLDDKAAWLHWTRSRGFPDPGDQDDARAVRDALRAAVGDAGASSVNGHTGLIRVELLGSVPTLVAKDAVGTVLAASARLAVLGDWNRVKICAASTCGCAFFDRSRNRSRTWCSMRVCGNRTKARNWRQRTRDGLIQR